MEDGSTMKIAKVFKRQDIQKINKKGDAKTTY